MACSMSSPFLFTWRIPFCCRLDQEQAQEKDLQVMRSFLFPPGSEDPGEGGSGVRPDGV